MKTTRPSAYNLLFLDLPLSHHIVHPRPRFSGLRPRVCASASVPDHSEPPEHGATAAAEIVSSAGYVVAPASALRRSPRARPPVAQRTSPSSTHLPPTPQPHVLSPQALRMFAKRGTAATRGTLEWDASNLARGARAVVREFERAASVAALAQIVDGCSCTPAPRNVDASAAADAQVAAFTASERVQSAARALLDARVVQCTEVRLRGGPELTSVIDANTSELTLYVPLCRKRDTPSESSAHAVSVRTPRGVTTVLRVCPGDVAFVGTGAIWKACSAAMDNCDILALAITYVNIE